MIGASPAAFESPSAVSVLPANENENAASANVGEQHANFHPRKSWALVSASGRIIHVSDNKTLLAALRQSGDQIARCEIGPISNLPSMPATKPKTSARADASTRKAEGVTRGMDGTPLSARQ